MAETSVINNPGIMIVLFAVLSLMPFLIVTTTSFVKLSAVISILRSALGTPQIPPNIVVTGLALVLTMMVMMPVLSDILYCLDESDINLQTISESDDITHMLETAIQCITPSLKKFLTHHTHESELDMIHSIAEKLSNDEYYEDHLILMIAAFLISELKEAFYIGFLIFLPFIVIDLVVANILQALGMVMMSPTTISLPFKLLLFVLADGWSLIIEGLLKSYL